MLSTLVAVVLYFAQAAPDAARPPAAQAAPSPAEATASQDKTVSPVTVTPHKIPPPQIAEKTVTCHEEVVLGSHFPRKVCASKAEFAERRALDQEQLREWVRLRPGVSN